MVLGICYRPRGLSSVLDDLPGTTYAGLIKPSCEDLISMVRSWLELGAPLTPLFKARNGNNEDFRGTTRLEYLSIVYYCKSE